MRVGNRNYIRTIGQKGILWLKIAVLTFASLIPVFISEDASAAQLTPRTLTLGTSLSNVETTHEFSFEMPADTPVQSIIFEYCTAPLGTCNLPPSMDIFTDTTVGQSGFQSGTFMRYTNATDQGDCTNNDTASATQVCITRDQDLDEPDETPLTITLGDVLNPTSTGVSLTFYVRITIYSDEAFATEVHQGTVAGAIVKQLTATGRVSERLIFCVGAMGDGETMPLSCSDPNFPDETSIDMGTIDNINVTTTPVDPSIANANLADDRYGLLIVNTNASGGVTVSYFPEAATLVTAGDTHQLRSFRVLPTDCSSDPTSETDQCFESAGTTASNPIVGGSEEFGMAVACVRPKSGTSTTNFKSNGGSIGAPYQGDGDFDDDNVGFVDDCENEVVDANYYWGFDDSGDPSTLATAATVVDDEAIKLRFGASAASTTPTGTYQVTTTYIATATF